MDIKLTFQILTGYDQENFDLDYSEDTLFEQVVLNVGQIIGIEFNDFVLKSANGSVIPKSKYQLTVKEVVSLFGTFYKIEDLIKLTFLIDKDRFRF